MKSSTKHTLYDDDNNNNNKYSTSNIFASSRNTLCLVGIDKIYSNK